MKYLEAAPPPAFFFRGVSPFTKLVFFSVLSLVLIATDLRWHYLDSVRTVFVTVLRPVEVGMVLPGKLFRSTAAYLRRQIYLVQENQHLRQQALQLSFDMKRLRVLENENAALRELLSGVKSDQYIARMGEITHQSRDPFTRRVFVNLGTFQHVFAGQAVMDRQGLIGQVVRADSFSSEVALVVSHDMAVPVQIQRTGIRAIAFGRSATDTLEMQHLPATMDVQQGDVLLTSGIDGVYPAGIPVAQVDRVLRNAEGVTASCSVLAGLHSHTHVLVVERRSPAQETPAKAAAPNVEPSREASHAGP